MNTTDNTGSALLDLSNTHAENAPSDVTTKKHKEHRSERRFRVKWRAVAVIDSFGMHHGFIKDISTKGTAVFLERSLHGARTLTLHIHVPALEAIGGQRVIEVQGKVVYSNHDSDELFFRSGIRFTKFKEESDLSYLGMRLKNCHVEID